MYLTGKKENWRGGVERRMNAGRAVRPVAAIFAQRGNLGWRKEREKASKEAKKKKNICYRILRIGSYCVRGKLDIPKEASQRRKGPGYFGG